ncbi:MAG: hypothetical protein ABFD92_12885 [Planctomycetaceae bacterium]|nr:hypothetical protein [Planctomycetaceae bacterium]
MSDKVEGTLIVEGLFEGRLPQNSDARGDLLQWIATAKAQGLSFSLEIDGNRFSLLPDNTPVHLSPGIGPGDRIVTQTLTSLLELFDPPQRLALDSTIRSTEYRRNEEVQTLYVVGPDGRVHSTQRVAAARTTAPPQPLSMRAKLKLAAVSLGIVALAVGVSTLFVDYRAWFGDLSDRMTALDANQIAAEAPAFAGLLTVGEKKLTRQDQTLVLELTLTAAKDFPADDAALEALLKGPNLPLRKRLAIESLARGYVRCDLYDKKGNAIAAAMPRLPALAAGKSATLQIALPSSTRPAKILIAP